LGGYGPLTEELGDQLDLTLGENSQSYWLFEIESKRSILWCDYFPRCLWSWAFEDSKPLSSSLSSLLFLNNLR